MPGYAEIDNKVIQTYLSAYHMADATILKTLSHGRYRISFGAKNLLNVRNLAARTVGAAHSSSANSTSLSTGRNYFLKFDINISSRS